MIKLKYNFLVIIKIILSIINTTLLINIFKVSSQSDAWLLALSIINVLLLILLMPISQFLVFYNELKTKSIKKAHNFYSCNLIFSLLFGIAFCIFSQLALDYIIKLFTFCIDIDRLTILKNILSISTFGLVFYPIVNLNEQLLNAEMKFSIPYILNILPDFFIVILQIFLIYTHSLNIHLLAYGQAAAWIISAVLSSLIIAKYIIKPKIVLTCNNFKTFMSNSVTMSLGNSFYHITMPTILNNFLVTMPQGYVSYFYYARKIMDIINAISTGPTAKIINSKFSKLFPQNKIYEIKVLQKQFHKFIIPVFILLLISSYYIQIPILKIISNNQLSLFDLHQIQLIFLSIIPWYFFMLIEMTYVMINIISKKSHILLLVNSSFILIFIFCMFVLQKTLCIYAIGCSAAIAQFFNFILHKKYAKTILKNIES